jgi:hypothetical protein
MCQHCWGLGRTRVQCHGCWRGVSRHGHRHGHHLHRDHRSGRDWNHCGLRHHRGETCLTPWLRGDPWQVRGRAMGIIACGIRRWWGGSSSSLLYNHSMRGSPQNLSIGFHLTDIRGDAMDTVRDVDSFCIAKESVVVVSNDLKIFVLYLDHGATSLPSSLAIFEQSDVLVVDLHSGKADHPCDVVGRRLVANSTNKKLCWIVQGFRVLFLLWGTRIEVVDWWLNRTDGRGLLLHVTMGHSMNSHWRWHGGCTDIQPRGTSKARRSPRLLNDHSMLRSSHLAVLPNVQDLPIP